MKENQVVYTCDNENCDHTQTHYPDRIGGRVPTFISVKLTKGFGGPVSTSEEFHFCDIVCLNEWSKGMIENMVYDKIAEGTEDEVVTHKALEGRQGGPIESFQQLPKGHPYEHPDQEKQYVPSRMNANKITPVGKVGIRTHSVKM